MLRCLLALTGLLLALAPPTDPPRFQVTVWVVRPVVRKLPTKDQLDRETRRWSAIHGLEDGTVLPDDDARLLAHLRKANPLLGFSGIAEKATATVPADTAWKAPLKGGSELSLDIKVAGREAAIADLARTRGREMADWFARAAAKQIVLFSRARIASEEPPGKLGGRPRFEGYRGVRPGGVYAINPDLAYQATLVEPPRPGAEAQYRVRQSVSDVLLFRIEPVAEKGHLRR